MHSKEYKISMLTNKKWFCLLIGTLVLSVNSLYNGYPLVYSDTGTYIYSGFYWFVPVNRPVAYGLFIKFFSLGYSLWFVVFIQNLITSFVVYEVLSLFFSKDNRLNLLYILVLAFLTFFTGIGWYTNQITPDLFAPLTILTLFLLLKSEKKNWSFYTLIPSILVYSMMVHFSHLIIGTFIVFLVLILKLILRKYFVFLPFRRLLYVLGVVVLSWGLLPCMNYMVEKKFSLTKGSHVFMMAHLDDAGILKRILDDKCQSKSFSDCKICMYKDSLPDNSADFLWDGKFLEKNGGWINSEPEFNRIIKYSLVHPKYLVLNIYKSFVYGSVQLVRNEIGHGLTAYTQGSPPYGQIAWWFPDELNSYMNSRQNKWNGANLSFQKINEVNNYVLIGSLFVLLFIFFTSIKTLADKTTLIFLIFALMSVVINSYLTAGINIPCERLQARVVWLVPFALIIFAVKNRRAIYIWLRDNAKIQKINC